MSLRGLIFTSHAHFSGNYKVKKKALCCHRNYNFVALTKMLMYNYSIIEYTYSSFIPNFVLNSKFSAKTFETEIITWQESIKQQIKHR